MNQLPEREHPLGMHVIPLRPLAALLVSLLLVLLALMLVGGPSRAPGDASAPPGGTVNGLARSACHAQHPSGQCA